MNRFPSELALLLGVDYAENYIKSRKLDQEPKEFLYSEQTECIPHMKKIIRNLIQVIEVNYLASVFQVSENFLHLISKKGKKAGHCLVCDIFSTNLKSHFKHFHDLNKEHYMAYKNSFGCQTERFYPSLTQKPKLFSPYHSKTPELHRFRELLNIKNKPRTAKNGKTSKSAPVSDKNQTNSSSSAGSKHSLRKILSNLATKYRERIQVSSLPTKKLAKKGKNLEKGFKNEQIVQNLEKNKGNFQGFRGFSDDLDIIDISGDLRSSENLKKLGKKTRKSKVKIGAGLLSDDLIQCPICSLEMKKKCLRKHLKRHETRDNPRFD